jgi:multidrug efflux pump subunit AcrA (membrane-fusion protein)
MQAVYIPWGRFWSVSPARPEPSKDPHPSGPVEVPKPEGPKKGGSAKWFVLGAVVIGLAVWALTRTGGPTGGPAPLTAVATTGELSKTLRIGGAVEARNYAAIRAPRMQGPRDAGNSALTLKTLAQPGAMVKAGEVIAEFELQWLIDHVDDTKSTVVQSKADVEKQRAQNMLDRETDRQALQQAIAEAEKAKLDLRTAPVKSEIEAELLKNMAAETAATAKALQQEFDTQEKVYAANMRVAEMTAQEQMLHLQRHQNDLEKMTVKSPLNGLVVMETDIRNGQPTQTAEGDQIRPGRLFMRVVDVSDMIVNANVNQADVQSVRIGQKAQVRLDAYPGLVLDGHITGMGAIAGQGGDPFRRSGSGLYLKTVPVEISIDAQDERVLPDLSASADIQLQSIPAEVIIPRSAVTAEGGEQHIVYVRGPQGFEPREVELGDYSDTHVIVTAGLEAGEVVLLGEPPSTT